jgi:hypothetical protein
MLRISLGCALVICLISPSVVNAERKVPSTTQRLKAGARATVYKDDKFSNQVKQRIDSNIDVDYGAGAPDGSIKGQKYSIRWFAWLDVPDEADYTVGFSVNGNVKLVIDDQTIIDYGSKNANRDVDHKMKLTKGLHFVQVDYRKSGPPGGGFVHLHWSTEKKKKETVPAERFFYEPAQ